MAIERISEIQLGDMLLIYEQETDYKRVGFYMIPADMREEDISDQKFYRINSLAQLKIAGDMYPNCYGHGQTMHNSESANFFEYISQDVVKKDGITAITTVMKDRRGYELDHVITYFEGEKSFETKNIFVNRSDKEVTLEMLSSFEMANLTPFIAGDAPNSMLVHRLRSKWSHEGRLVSESVENLQLEPSWSNWSVGVERFGARGSMPVMKYFPFVAVEDTVNHVLWGAQLAHEASWQMEIYRQDDGLHISGGLADREFGHWMKEVAPGDSFETPKAILSVGKGDVDEICHRLVSAGVKYVDEGPESEQTLPIIFNEYCTTWGCPSHENICGIVDAIKDKGFDYFVIDCGWFKEDGVPWDISMGDYNVSPSLFPEGLEKTVSVIRDAGMKPGIWFEIDNVGSAAKAYHETDHLLKRDGYPLSTYSRRFWDMRDPWVMEYLHEKVIGTLQKYGFEYMKMDYNDTIGIGCDGCESLGEGLRQNMEASVDFVKQVKDEVPGIILENCASGGHKLEPLMMSLCSMASFSDAHETEEIPIIAANLHRAILPRQSQIWAVIRKTDSLKRIGYSIANTFLGRMCLSGDVTDLSDAQWDVIDRGIAFYKEVAPVIKDGISHRRGPKITSDRHPEGYQVMIQTKEDGESLVVIHCFNGELPEMITVELEGMAQNIVSSYSYDGKADIRVENGKLYYRTTENMCAVAIHLK
ncbi:MAG: glycoside hydrolase family 36 protein [Eubacterium sp.]|nr:glycoside hydrolase family 36 protein [Eubacterium sp.]